MEITRAEMAEKLKQIRQARIYFHKKPDGDAVGAAYGLALGLQARGIPCELRCSDPVPAAYRWMTDQVPARELDQAAEIVVDTAAPGRLGRYKDQPMDLCIDHHEGNTIQAAYKYVVPEASSCSELVFWLLRDMGLGMLLAVPADQADRALEVLKAAGEKAYLVGSVVAGEDGVELI